MCFGRLDDGYKDNVLQLMFTKFAVRSSVESIEPCLHSVQIFVHVILNMHFCEGTIYQ